MSIKLLNDGFNFEHMNTLSEYMNLVDEILFSMATMGMNRQTHKSRQTLKSEFFFR